MTSEQFPFLPFALPDIGEEEIAEVVDTLRSGWVTTGPKTKRFEQDFAAFLGDAALRCMAVNSATAGLHLALEALGIGPGDEVITTTHTFTATAEVVRYLGADVVLVDIDPATLCIDIAAIEAAITPRTKAVMPVHYAGLAVDMQALLALAKRHGIKVVEDAAHALPTTSGGELVGTLASDVCVFSFYANKTITTGEGGMVVTRNAELARRIQVMRLHGMSRDACDRFTAKVPSWYYEIVAPRDRQQRRHVGREAAVVDRQDGPGAWCDRRLDELGIDAQRGRVDVDQHHVGAEVAHDLGGGRERVRGRDDLVAGADAERLEREVQAGGRGVDGHAVQRRLVRWTAEKGREVVFEALRLRPGRDPAGTQCVDDLGDLCFADVGQRERQERQGVGHRRGETSQGLAIHASTWVRSSGTALNRV